MLCLKSRRHYTEFHHPPAALVPRPACQGKAAETHLKKGGQIRHEIGVKNPVLQGMVPPFGTSLTHNPYKYQQEVPFETPRQLAQFRFYHHIMHGRRPCEQPRPHGLGILRTPQAPMKSKSLIYQPFPGNPFKSSGLQLIAPTRL